MNTNLTSTWNYPTTVWVGPGRIKELSKACGESGIQRPLLVTDSELATRDLVRETLADLQKATPAARLFSRVKSNPIEINVLEGVEAFRGGATRRSCGHRWGQRTRRRQSHRVHGWATAPAVGF